MDPWLCLFRFLGEILVFHFFGPKKDSRFLIDLSRFFLLSFVLPDALSKDFIDRSNSGGCLRIV